MYFNSNRTLTLISPRDIHYLEILHVNVLRCSRKKLYRFPTVFIILLIAIFNGPVYLKKHKKLLQKEKFPHQYVIKP